MFHDERLNVVKSKSKSSHMGLRSMTLLPLYIRGLQPSSWSSGSQSRFSNTSPPQHIFCMFLLLNTPDYQLVMRELHELHSDGQGPYAMSTTPNYLKLSSLRNINFWICTRPLPAMSSHTDSSRAYKKTKNHCPGELPSSGSQTLSWSTPQHCTFLMSLLCVL